MDCMAYEASADWADTMMLTREGTHRVIPSMRDGGAKHGGEPRGIVPRMVEDSALLDMLQFQHTTSEEAAVGEKVPKVAYFASKTLPTPAKTSMASLTR